MWLREFPIGSCGGKYTDGRASFNEECEVVGGVVNM